MPKQTAASSSSNVPRHSTGNSSSKTKSSSPQKPNSNSSLHSSTVLNSKHLHNQSHQQNSSSQKPRDNENPGLTDNNCSELMKKLSEAVHKQQKEKESSGDGGSSGRRGNNSNSSTSNVMDATKNRRSRKGTAPAGVTLMQNSTTYAGAAFDRAPPATSFPIPSFIAKSPPNSTSSALLSQSCPLPSSLESPSLKSLSISEFFPAEQPKDKKKLDTLTEDLRKLLNLK